MWNSGQEGDKEEPKRDKRRRVDGKQTDCGLNEQAYQPEYIRKYQN